MKNSIKKNYLLNLLYEIFALVTPVFVMPYISRVLGASGVGVYSYTYSIIYYFMLIGALGFSTYARREISKKRDDEYYKYKVFWEITIVKAVVCVISAALYEILIVCAFRDTYYFVFLQTIIIYIIGTAFDITYFFQAQEEFEKIVYRNIIIKTIGILLIFILVKSTDDLYAYILLQALIFVAGNIILWLTLPKDAYSYCLIKKEYKKHLRPAVKLFVPTVASSIYTMLDKTLMGSLIIDTDVNNESIVDAEIGVYEQVEKIVKMAVTALTSLSVIISPRNSYYYAKKKIEKIRNVIRKSYIYVMFASFPMMFGLALVANYFCPIFFGAGYDKAPLLITLLSPLVILISVSGVFGMQYLTAIGEDNKYVISVVCGAVINIVLNVLLIPAYASYGAAAATVIAEFAIMVLLIIFSRKAIKIRAMLSAAFRYCVGALAAYLPACFIIVSDPIATIALRATVFAIIYGLSMIIMKDEVIYDIITTIKKVKRRIRR